MKKTKRGFTIVELVIVIAVIAILAAILIPVFANVTDSANEASLKAEIKNAYSAFVADVALDGDTYESIEEYIFGDGTDYYKWDASAGEDGKGAWVDDDAFTKGAEDFQSSKAYNGFTLYIDNPAAATPTT